MDASEVQDRESLEKYLKALPEDEQRAVAVRVAFRAAARVLPIAVRSVFGGSLPTMLGVYPLPLFEGVLLVYLSSSGLEILRDEIVQFSFGASFYETDLDAFETVADALTAVRRLPSGKSDRLVSAVVSVVIDAQCAIPMSDFWERLQADMTNKRSTSLWLGSLPTGIATAWRDAKTALQSDTTADWSFWIAWYERVLAGRDMQPDALVSIFNKLTQEDWEKGPAHINPMFDDVLAMYRADDVGRPLAEIKMPPGKPEQIEKTKTAMVTHRRELPANCDAILGYITLEIGRLQGRNYRDDDERDEAVRQIGVLTTLYDAISRLATLIPQTDDMPQADAVEAESLVRLYVGKFKEWPRANADEMVDNTCRFALVGLTAMTLPMVGVSATVATIAGAAFFGSERILKNIKSAKDALKPDGG